LRAAAIQLNATDDVDRNLETADRLVREAASLGAELVVLPEKWTVLGTREQMAAGAQTLDGPAVAWARDTAVALGIDLIAGSFFEHAQGDALGSNTSVHVGPDGQLKAVYRKIHMFDFETDDLHYAESSTERSGDEIVVSELGDGTKLGMSICYDLRFPELYRSLESKGARVVTVPAAFTLTTGKDHWHVLLRARAIENQIFVIAPAQTGKHPKGRQTYGKSLIVDPWGDVVAQAGEGEGFALARLDPEYQERVRRALPTLSHKKL
jgi:deaminated glutathione amidase